MLFRSGSVLQVERMPLNLTYLECILNGDVRSSQQHIPITAVPVQVYQTCLLTRVSGGGEELHPFRQFNEVNTSAWFSGGSGMWHIAPEFTFRDSNISSQKHGVCSAVADRLLLRYETQLHADDLKDLKEVQLSFAHQKP